MKKNSKSMLKTEGRNLNLKSKSINLNENNKLDELHVSAGKNLSVLDSSKNNKPLPTANMAESKAEEVTANMAESDVLEVAANMAESEVIGVTANMAGSDIAKVTASMAESGIAGVTASMAGSGVAEVTANMAVSKKNLYVSIEGDQEKTDYFNKIEELENHLKVKKTIDVSNSVKENNKKKTDENSYIKPKKQQVKPVAPLNNKNAKNSANKTNSAIKLPLIKKKSLIVNHDINDADDNIIKEETGSGGLSGTISENEDIEGSPDIEKKLKVVCKDNNFETPDENEDVEEIPDIERKLKVVYEDNKKYSNEIIRKEKFNTNLKVKRPKNNKSNTKESKKNKSNSEESTNNDSKAKKTKKDKSNKLSDLPDKIPFLKKYMYIRQTLKSLESDRLIENVLLKIFSFFVSVLLSFVMNIIIVFCLFFAITIAVIGMLAGVIIITVVALVTIFSFIFGVFFDKYQVDTKSPDYLTNYIRTELHSEFISNCQRYTKNPELYNVVYARLDENGKLCDVDSGIITETDALEKAYLAKMYAENHESATDTDALNQYLIIDTDEEKKVLKEIHDKMFFIIETDIEFNEVVNGKQVKRTLVRIYSLTLKQYLAIYSNEISSSERTYIEDFERYDR